MESFVYIVHSEVPEKKLNKLLPAKTGYKIQVESGEMVEGDILDTFDNAALSQSLLLLGLEGRLVLMNLKTGEFLEQEVAGEWSFAKDLSAGPVEELLAGLADLRAFLPVAKVTFHRDRGVLLDDEGKTRARYSSLVVHHKKAITCLGAATSLRGYQSSYEDLVAFLQKAGAKELTDVFAFYRQLGIKREFYTNKPALPLDATATASETAAVIIRAFMQVARRNESGIIGDHDTEFLHDYRVSFRKVRSVLSLFKGVYEPGKTTELKAEFALIMQSTNRLRDLDVYLMEKESYYKMVPEPSVAGLELLFLYLAKERKKELKKVVKDLQSEEYAARVDALTSLFKSSKKIPIGPKGALPSKLLAAHLVLKRYNQVCKIASSIEKTTPDSVIHELRISCKKLRYLMEFFTPLFDGESVKTLIKTLKNLQDNLGKFNDYSVQQAFLRHILDHDLGQFKGKEIQISEAVGALTAMLFRMQKKERNQVVNNFSRFNSEETRLLFKQLFEIAEVE
jgi:CHAD domain-containing protein